MPLVSEKASKIYDLKVGRWPFVTKMLNKKDVCYCRVGKPQATTIPHKVKPEFALLFIHFDFLSWHQMMVCISHSIVVNIVAEIFVNIQACKVGRHI